VSTAGHIRPLSAYRGGVRIHHTLQCHTIFSHLNTPIQKLLTQFYAPAQSPSCSWTSPFAPPGPVPALFWPAPAPPVPGCMLPCPSLPALLAQTACSSWPNLSAPPVPVCLLHPGAVCLLHLAQFARESRRTGPGVAGKLG
jgi:hypothetical protein